MKLLKNMERRFGRYAIRNLSMIVIMTYVIGYIMEFTVPGVLNYLTLDPYMIFRHGQVWRLITWILIPPESLDIFTIIMLFFYYSIAKVLERTWGDFLFNVYIFSGLIMTVIGACVMYFILAAAGTDGALTNMMGIPLFCSTYYVNMSIFLAFALTYPDMQVLLYFFIPIRMKWMGYLYGAFLIYRFIKMPLWSGRILMIISLLNFLIYFLSTRDMKRLSPQEFRRRANFRKAVNRGRKAGTSDSSYTSGKSSRGKTAPKGSGFDFGTWNARQKDTGSGQSVKRPSQGFTKINPGGAVHRCAICGRTELTDPELEFRYCSKCEGSYEYCQDHLFTHIHVKNKSKPSLTPEGQDGGTKQE